MIKKYLQHIKESISNEYEVGDYILIENWIKSDRNKELYGKIVNIDRYSINMGKKSNNTYFPAAYRILFFLIDEVSNPWIRENQIIRKLSYSEILELEIKIAAKKYNL